MAKCKVLSLYHQNCDSCFVYIYLSLYRQCLLLKFNRSFSQSWTELNLSHTKQTPSYIKVFILQPWTLVNCLPWITNKNSVFVNVLFSLPSLCNSTNNLKLKLSLYPNYHFWLSTNCTHIHIFFLVLHGKRNKIFSNDTTLT